MCAGRCCAINSLSIHTTNGLAQSETKQAFDGQTKLDGGITEGRRSPLSTRRLTVPLHVSVKPDQQGTTGLEGRVVVFPIRGAVLGGSRLSHDARLQEGAFVQQRRR